MDAVAVIYYALVCALLSAASPRVPRLPARLAIGAAVGVAAAAILPVVRDMLAGY